MNSRQGSRSLDAREIYEWRLDNGKRVSIGCWRRRKGERRDCSTLLDTVTVLNISVPKDESLYISEMYPFKIEGFPFRSKMT